MLLTLLARPHVVSFWLPVPQELSISEEGLEAPVVDDDCIICLAQARTGPGGSGVTAGSTSETSRSQGMLAKWHSCSVVLSSGTAGSERLPPCCAPPPPAARLQGCPRLRRLALRHCAAVTDAAVRAVAARCKQMQVCSSALGCSCSCGASSATGPRRSHADLDELLLVARCCKPPVSALELGSLAFWGGLPGARS